MSSAALQANEKGWDCKLFINIEKVDAFKCKKCQQICKNAVELGCDHDDNEIDLYCSICLKNIIKLNDNKCPINSKHINPQIQSNRSSRKQILNLKVMCPNSERYQRAIANDNIDDNNVYDTLSDEKEGGLKNYNMNKQNKDSCNWVGILNKLITEHLPKCKAMSKDIMIKNMDLMKEQIDAILFDNNNLKKRVYDLEQKLSVNNTEIMLKKLIQNESLNNNQKIHNLTKQVNTIQNAVVAKDKKINNLETQVNKLMNLVQNINKTLSKQPKELMNKTEKINSLQKQLNSKIDDEKKQQIKYRNDDEYFSILGDHIKKTNNSKTITKTKGSISTTYGNICIDSMSGIVCKWEMKVDWMPDGSAAIGISSDHTARGGNFCQNTQSSNYAYFLWNGKKVSRGQEIDYGKSWKTGDIIGVGLDLKKRNIQFYLNGKNQGVAYTNIDVGENVSYKLSVYMYKAGVTLQSFRVL